MQNYEYLLSPIDKIDGVGKKTANLFIKKKIFTIFDLLWHLPLSKIEKYEEVDIKKLQIGKKQNIKLTPIKYNFPRIRNLPNKVICENKNERLDCIFFNSYEGYIKKILPLNNEVLINGKIGFYKNKYQIVNPKIVGVIQSSISGSLTIIITLPLSTSSSQCPVFCGGALFPVEHASLPPSMIVFNMSSFETARVLSSLDSQLLKSSYNA